MTVWIDADSCPRRVREIISRAAIRERVPTVFAANRLIPIPDDPVVSIEVVQSGDTDGYILERVRPGDMVVTRDIPLAADLVDRNICVLNDRGTVFSHENVGERLSLRDFMKELRDRGAHVPESSVFGKREASDFARAFDTEFSRLLRNAKK